MAAQQRETNDPTTATGWVGVAALMAAAAVAVTAPVAAVGAAAVVAAAVVVRRRDAVGRFAGRDTRDGPGRSGDASGRPCPGPAACD